MNFQSITLVLLLYLSLGSLCSQVISHNGQTEDAQSIFKRAKQFELFNDPRAEQEYKRAIDARGGQYPEALEKLSWYLARELRFQEASIELNKFINQIPKKDQASYKQDLVKLQRAADLQTRIKELEKPELADLIEYTSLVRQFGKNKLKDSVPYAEKAVSLYPMSSEAYVALAGSLVNSGQRTRIYDLLNKAIELDPQNAEAHLWLGWHYNAAFQGQEATEEFQKALELSNGRLAEAWQGLGWAYYYQGRNKKAIEAFRKYLESGQVSRDYIEAIKRIIKELGGNS